MDEEEWEELTSAITIHYIYAKWRLLVWSSAKCNQLVFSWKCPKFRRYPPLNHPAQMALT